MRSPLLRAIVAAAVTGVGAAARFLPRRHTRIPYTARPAAFGTRRISILRGGADNDAEEDFWQEEIRRTKAFYGAPTSKAKEVLINGRQPEVENAGEEEAFAVDDDMGEDETVFGNAHTESSIDEEGSDIDEVGEESYLAESVDRGELDVDKDESFIEAGSVETENAGEEEAWEVQGVMIDAEDETVANQRRDRSTANDEAERIGAEEETQSQGAETDPTVTVEKGEDQLEHINAETENAGEEEAWEVEDVMDDAEDDMVANQEEEDLLVAEESNGNAEDASGAEVEVLAVDASDELRFYSSIDSDVSNIDDNTTPKGGIASLANGIRKKVSALLTGKDPQSLLIVTLSAGAALLALFRPRDPETAQTVDTTSSIEIPTSDMSAISILSEEEKEEDFNQEMDDKAPPALEVADHNLDESWLDKLISLVLKPFGGGA
ncbi:hypothetical protein ACHAXT_004476 [Thalassiosira profunda]